MKTNILFAALMVFATSAFASSVTVEATHLNSKTNKVAIVPSFDVAGLTLDARLEGARGADKRTSNEIELRVGKNFPLTANLSANIRVGAGKSFGSYTESFQSVLVLPTGRRQSKMLVEFQNDYKFYSVEPSVKYTVNQALSLKVSDRYTNSFGNGKNTSQHEFGIGAEYALTKKDAVAVTAIHQHGTSNGNGVKLAYIRSF